MFFKLIVTCFMLHLTGVVWCNTENEISDNNELIKDNNEELIKLKQIENKIFKIISNSTNDQIKSFGELLHIFDTRAGNELRGLLVEGVMIGMNQKNSNDILMHFWSQLLEHLSPEFSKNISEYFQFFKGVDLWTLPMTIEKLFEKDQLGNSLASMPLGQLIDLIQPEASKYGIDIRNMVNSILDLRDNPQVYEIFSKFVDNFNVSTVTKFFTKPIASSANNESDIVGEDQTKLKKRKKPNTEQTLLLFKPFLLHLLKENEVDLEADAIIELVASIIENSGDVYQIISPLLSSFMGENMDTRGLAQLLPLLGLLGQGRKSGKKSSKNQEEVPDLLTVAATMLGGLSKDGNNLEGLLSVASQFIGGGQKSGSKKKPPSSGFGLDALASLASKISSGGDIDSGMLLQMAGSFIGNGLSVAADARKKKNKPKKTKVQKVVQNEKTEKKHLIEVIEPLLLSLHKDEKCHKKVKDAFVFGKAILNKKFPTISEVQSLIPVLVESLYSRKDISPITKVVDKDTMRVLLSSLVTQTKWSEILVALEKPEVQENIIESSTPHFIEFIYLIADKNVQNNLYKTTQPHLSEFLESFGLNGVTLSNFPERLAPLVAIMSRGWELPFNPVPMLKHLRDYLVSVQEFVVSSLESVQNKMIEDVEADVKSALEDVIDSVLLTTASIRGSNLACLPHVLCKLNARIEDEKEGSIRLTVTRLVSLMYGVPPTLEAPDSSVFVRNILAIFVSKTCKEEYPKYCKEIAQRPPKIKKMDPEYNVKDSEGAVDDYDDSVYYPVHEEF